jgi:3-hydroxyacyl-CoA dehydrogenase
MTTIPYAEYEAKFATLLAGGDLPEVVQLMNLAACAKACRQGAFADLSDVLGGDGILEYKNLSNIRPDQWKASAIDGRIYGVPIDIPAVQTQYRLRRDWAEKLGFPDDPKNAEELAEVLLEEGADIEQIDRAMKDFGFPVGPFANLDEVGIDVGANVAGVLKKLFTARGGKTSNKATELVNAGYKGRKNQKGFYRYNGKKKEVNTEIYQFFGGQERKKMDTEEIQFRIAMMMINEAVYCLQEGILMSPSDGDIGAIFGLGFPPFLGGPFRYIDREGVDEILDFLYELENDHGRRFAPADLLLEYARKNKPFHSG